MNRRANVFTSMGVKRWDVISGGGVEWWGVGGLRGGWNVVEEWHDKWMVKKYGSEEDGDIGAGM